jgi:hypothetical protein
MRYQYTGATTRSFTVDGDDVTLSPGTEYDFTDAQLAQIPFNERGWFREVAQSDTPSVSHPRGEGGKGRANEDLHD